MKLNAQFAHEMRMSSATFTLDDLGQRFQTLPKQLEDSGAYRRGEDVPPILTKGAVTACAVGRHSEAGEWREAISDFLLVTDTA
jgi:hypothetical protein